MALHPEHLLQVTLVLTLPRESQKDPAAASDVFWPRGVEMQSVFLPHSH